MHSQILRHTHWFEDYVSQYEALAAGAAALERIEAYKGTCIAMILPPIIESAANPESRGNQY